VARAGSKTRPADPGALDDRHPRRHDQPLRLNAEGIGLLRDRLRAASDRRSFEKQYDRLAGVLMMALDRLRIDFADDVECVLAVGEWARRGVDLGQLPTDDVVIQIVSRSSERRFDLYTRLAELVFADLDDGEILLQFSLVTLPEWRRAEDLARFEGREQALGVPLLTRA
jgi:hypothetical protein